MKVVGGSGRIENMFDMRVDFFRPQHGSPEQRAAITRTLLETLAPGPDLATLLASLDPAGLDMYDLVSHLGACERQTAWVQARQLSAVRELAGRRLVPGPHGEPADSAFPDGMINEFAADEVAAQLSLSRRAGQKRVWLATALTRLPATAAAFAAGQLTLSKVWAIAESLSVLDEDAATEAETRVLGRGPGPDPEQFEALPGPGRCRRRPHSRPGAGSAGPRRTASDAHPAARRDV